ncbi:hypothetical protein [Bifidobacterium magnum]|uniref:Putative Bacteriophage CII protein n=1 Tax=Bifidobacterium magnum TaxID=1692 RepID=A0A087B9N2_9BIFI|nr:hypothetical protein [Bifidobacterium magnum]KFI67732.1 putative Bacteriophage CII protein [Bifidobacterium magnum]
MSTRTLIEQIIGDIQAEIAGWEADWQFMEDMNTNIVDAGETIETISTAMVRKCYRRIGEAKENNLDDTSEEGDA